MTSPLAPTAARLQLPVAALEAVIAVECGGLGHGLVAGRPTIRLEVHHLWRRVPIDRREAVDAEFNVAGVAVPTTTPTRATPPQGVELRPWLGHQWHEGAVWRALHTGQELEWRAFEAAARIDYPAAVAATSWGLGQVLGADWAGLGYRTAGEFVAKQMTEAGQIDTLGRYLDLSGAAQRLRALDWAGFARIYNGVGAVDHYARRLAEAYARAGGR